MAYVYDNKTYRNLQQQVKENMDDIARLQSLKLVGLDVSYIVDTEEDLADITAKQGMVVAVGTEQPYTLFVYNDSSWVNFGEFPKAGPQGEQGPQGQVGNPGPRGLTGEPGPRGYTGAAGPAGSPGPQGARGPQGPKGDKGDRGVVDAYAADAESITAVGQAYVDENGYLQVCTSLSPLTFEQGGSVKGPKGDTGEQGPQGIQGEQGAQGPTGATGPQGARGPQGEQGIRGPQGEQGIQGPQGPTGATGPEGPQGPKGDTGAQGPTGPTGPQGPKGDPGLTASVEVNGQVYTTDSTGKITLPDYPDEVAWGNITGTLSEQTDLQSALDAKVNKEVIIDKFESPQITGYVDNAGDNVGIGVNYGEGGHIDDKYTTVNTSPDTIALEASRYGLDFTLTTSMIEMTPDSITFNTPAMSYVSGKGYTITFPDGGNNDTVALHSEIPDLTNYVTTDTAQNITAAKTFTDNASYPTTLRANYSGIVAKYSAKETSLGSGGLTIKDTAAGKTKLLQLSVDDNGPEINSYVNNTSAYLRFPNSSGTLALTSDIPTTMAWSDITGKPTFATVATSGSYNDLSNKPTIPTVGNATLTIQKNGTSVGTFNANATSNKTINITVPTATSDLTNDSGFITSSAIPTNYVTTNTQQTINGAKSFVANTKFTAYNYENTDYININTTTLSNNYLAIIPVTSSGISSYCGTQLNPWTSVNADVINADDINVTNVYANNLINGTTTIAVANIADKTNLATVATTGDYDDLNNKPTKTVLWSRTPDAGLDTTGLTTITLNDNVTNYDYIEIAFNDNDSVNNKLTIRFDNVVINDNILLSLQRVFNSTPPRIYTKWSQWKVTAANTLTYVASSQVRIGNGEANVVTYKTDQIHARPYKIIGYKF